MHLDLTVILPLHNGQQYLRETLDSAASEAPKGVRFLAYDSSENGGDAASLVSEFANRLDIRYASTPDIKPWQDKVNLGFKEAITPLVAILHQDDLWLPGHLDAVQQSFNLNPGAVMSIGPSRFIDAQSRYVGAWKLPFDPGLVGGRNFAEKLIVQNTIAVPSVVYLRQAWLDAGGMDRNLWYTPDWDIYLALARFGDIAVRPSATTAFRLHGSSLTMSGSTNIDDFRQQQELVLARHASHWGLDPQSKLFKRAKMAIDINCSLALAARGHWREIIGLLPRLIAIGPSGLVSLHKETRLLDRIKARLPLLARR